MASFADVDVPDGVARRAIQGYVDAQAELYRLLAPVMMGMAVRILHNHAAAEEVVQDVFVQLIEKVHTLKEPAAIVPWTRKIAVNHCLMRLRSPWQKRRGELALVGELEDASAAEQRMEDLHDVARSLGALTPETRMVIWLHEVEGYTHKEIGGLLGKTSSYSKSQLARGIQSMLGKRGTNGQPCDGIRSTSTP